jgi:hypothetical protein
MVTLSVNKVRPGDEPRARKNGTLRISAEAWAPESIGAPKTLEIVVQGRVIRSAEAASAQAGKLRLQFDIPAGASQWMYWPMAQVSPTRRSFTNWWRSG